MKVGKDIAVGVEAISRSWGRWPGHHPEGTVTPHRAAPALPAGEAEPGAAGCVEASHGSVAAASRARPNPFFPASGTNHPLCRKA